jgi:hypothetical protein
MASNRRGLDGRMRDEDGTIREKNGNTHLGTIEKEYGVDFGRRSDMKLDNYLAEEGYDSMTQAVRDHQ